MPRPAGPRPALLRLASPCFPSPCHVSPSPTPRTALRPAPRRPTPPRAPCSVTCAPLRPAPAPRAARPTPRAPTPAPQPLRPTLCAPRLAPRAPLPVPASCAPRLVTAPCISRAWRADIQEFALWIAAGAQEVGFGNPEVYFLRHGVSRRRCAREVAFRGSQRRLPCSRRGRSRFPPGSPFCGARAHWRCASRVRSPRLCRGPTRPAPPGPPPCFGPARPGVPRPAPPHPATPRPTRLCPALYHANLFV